MRQHPLLDFPVQHRLQCVRAGRARRDAVHPDAEGTKVVRDIADEMVRRRF